MLTITDLHQTFHAGEVNEIHALRGIDLTLPARQFVTVIGSNGAGKSTLFNTIAGVFPPTRGRILIDGQDVTDWPEHRRAYLVGRVFQNPLLGTAASMSIAQNLTLALLRSQRLRLRTGVTPDRLRQFGEWLEPLGLGLETRLESKVALLSGGQRQALTLLMAVLAQPKLLLLDEHTAALDPATAVKILELTGQIIEQQEVTTLMITHNMQQALTFGDRTLMMDAGQIVLDLSAAEKANLSVQDLIDKFTVVRRAQLVDDELLLMAD
ncbi:MAG: ATP-binding cassette domain-containing protein [Caldilineaceae bacterium]|nr:ATP-binding cassette domain-containing protein [Caldilineaceae bacterium]